MCKQLEGAVLYLEHDHNDQQRMLEIISKLGIKNHVEIFKKGDDLIFYLLASDSQPLIVISDLDPQSKEGIETRKKILEIESLKKKSIPFYFLLSPDSDLNEVLGFTKLNAEGVLVKLPILEKMTIQISLVLNHCMEFLSQIL